MADGSTAEAAAAEAAAVAAGETAGTRLLRLDLEYDGTDFAGWQVQPGLRTVQGDLEAALRRVLDEPRACAVAAGRTDSGTHALGQVAHVRTRSRIALDSLAAGVNTALARDLRLRRASEAPAGFHARFSATCKEYRYHVWHSSPVPPFLRNYCWGVRQPLDVAAMAEAARLFVGTHDLSSFRAASCTARTPERTVYGSVVAGHGELAVYAIHARGFLQHMVRIVASTLVQVGRGRLGPAEVESILAARDRAQAPPTAPAQGLFLVRVGYDQAAIALEARADPVLAFGHSSRPQARPEPTARRP